MSCVYSLSGQITRINVDTLKIRSGSITKGLVVGDSSVSIAFPSTNGTLALQEGASTLPVGTVTYVLNHLPVPDGFVRADGQALSRTAYSELFDKIGTTYGAGNGSTTFNVPVIIDPYVPRAGLVGWWSMNGDAKDRSYHRNDATVQGATLTDDRYGRSNMAYYFNGTTNYLFVSNAFFNNGWNEWTYSIWARLDNNANPISIYFNTSPHSGVGIGAGTGTKYRIGVGNAAGTWPYLDPNGVWTNADYVKNQWEHICVVRKGLSVKYYINGVMDKELTMTGLPGPANCQMYIGICNCPNEGTRGKLDDAGIWSRALTADEVTALHRSAHYAVIRWKP
jgi:hypothetical protein